MLISGLTETDAQHARRAILNLLPLHHGRIMKDRTPKSKLNTARAIDTEVAIDTDTLPYIFRDRDYQRKVQATGDGAATRLALDDARRQTAFEKIRKTSFTRWIQSEFDYKLARTSQTDAMAQSHWEESPMVNLYAQLGQSIALPRSLGASERRPDQPQVDGVHDHFLHSVSHSSQLLSFLEKRLHAVDKQFQPPMTTELIFHFVPSPWAKSTVKGLSLNHFPATQVRFKSTNSEEIPQFFDISAFLANDNLDVLLPCFTSDIRFTKTARLVRSTMDAEIASLIRSIETSISTGGALRAPATVNLHVPYSSSPERHTTRIPHPQHKWDASFSELVPYLFTGVEHRQMVHLEFNDYPLDFTMVEAGRMGGRWSEMTLRLPPGKLEEITKDKRRVEGAKAKTFFGSAVDLAYLSAHAANGTLGEIDDASFKVKPAYNR